MLRSRVVGSLEPAEPNDHHAKGNRFLDKCCTLNYLFVRFHCSIEWASQVIVDSLHNMLKCFVHYASASVCFIAALRSQCALYYTRIPRVSSSILSAQC
jgi:hypothetical protein